MAREWCGNSYLLWNIGYSTIGKRYWKTIKEIDIDNKTAIKETVSLKKKKHLHMWELTKYPYTNFRWKHELPAIRNL